MKKWFKWGTEQQAKRILEDRDKFDPAVWVNPGSYVDSSDIGVGTGYSSGGGDFGGGGASSSYGGCDSGSSGGCDGAGGGGY